MADRIMAVAAGDTDFEDPEKCTKRTPGKSLVNLELKVTEPLSVHVVGISPKVTFDIPAKRTISDSTSFY